MSERWPMPLKNKIIEAAQKLKAQGKPLTILETRFPGRRIPENTVRCWLRDFQPGYEKNPAARPQKWSDEYMVRICAAYELVKDSGIPMTEFAKQFYNHPSRTTIDNRYRKWWPKFKEANPALVRKILRQQAKQLFPTGQPLALSAPSRRQQRSLTQTQLEKLAKRLMRAGGIVLGTAGILGRRHS